jgi:transcriptional regulator
MYVPEHFRESESAKVEQFLRDIAIAELVSWNGSTIDASTLPLTYEKCDSDTHHSGTSNSETIGSSNGRLVGHFARSNPQWRCLSPDTEVLAIFRGSNGYISPSWYPTKTETGRVVPTWNYVSVQVRGTPIIHDDDAWKLDLVTRLTEQHEEGRVKSWTVSDAPQDFIEKQLRAIVGIEIAISRLDAKWKLSQNQPERNREGAIVGLLEEDTTRSRDLAEFMRNQ